jgi:hypothetical protein
VDKVRWHKVICWKDTDWIDAGSGYLGHCANCMRRTYITGILNLAMWCVGGLGFVLSTSHIRRLITSVLVGGAVQSWRRQGVSLNWVEEAMDCGVKWVGQFSHLCCAVYFA